MVLDVYRIIKKLSEKRKIFVSEADFQLEFAWIIKELYPNAIVRLEYSPAFDTNMHIDILVIIDNMWIPIELKYKTKGCRKIIDGELYDLKNHSAKDVNCYAYLNDIQRIEKIKDNIKNYAEGYAILLTNESSYLKSPTSRTVNYYDFSIHKGAIKQGSLDWAEGTSEGTKGQSCKLPIILKNSYEMKWDTYSIIDSSNTGTFNVLINKII